ncbi:MAG: hypothetical protein R6X02_25060 [Enhygromyxa sp.]
MSDLLHQLAEAGALEARGGFTIDPEKAREKLRQYQLADPHRYVLLLVEAAVSCGASRLDFEIDSDDLHLRFDGSSFRYEQLENIYGSLFASAGEVALEELARLRGLQQLAFAINSAMALNPRFVRVVSVDDEGLGARLELRPDAPDQIEQLEASPPGNWVHVKDRFRPGLVLEFFRSLGGKLAEIQLLRGHCRWSRTAIYVNRERISGPVEFEGEYWTAVDVFDPPEGGSRIGRAALGLMRPEHGLIKPRAELLANGVFIESVAVLGGVPGFHAIVDSPRFGKDVSQTKLLRDRGFDLVMEAIADAQGRVIARLAERCVAGTGPSWAHEVLLAWLALGRFGGLRRALREDPNFALVAEVPLWPVIGAAKVSTRALIEGEGPIRFASESFGFAPLDVPFVLDLVDDPDRSRARVLEKLFGSRLHDYTAALRREHERQRKRLEFMARTHLPELGEGHYPIREVILGGRSQGDRTSLIGGELGVRVLGLRDGWVRLLHEGCVLQEVRIEQPIPGLCAVVQAELSPTDDYQAARPDERLAAALVAVLETLHRAMSSLAASGAVSAQHTELRELLRGYVAAVEISRPDFAIEFLTQFGFSRSQAKRELQRLPGSTHAAIRPDWRLDQPAGERHPLAEVPLYAQVHGEPRSLAQLHARRAEGQRLAWLEPGSGPFPPLDVEVLLLDQRDREVLRALLGSAGPQEDRGDALEPFAERLAWIRRRDAFLERPTAALELPHASLIRVALRGEGLRGELGLRTFSFTEASKGATPVRVLYRERELCELTLELPLPGLVAWVESDAFEVGAGFDGLAHPLSLRQPLLHALISLVEAELDRALREPRDLRRSEWWFLLMVPNLVFGAGGLAHAFMRLRAARGQEQALIDLDSLLALLERSPSRDLDRALGRLRGHDQLPTPDVVQRQLRRTNQRPSEAELDALTLRRGLLALLGRLLELPLFRRFEGAPVDGNSSRLVTLGSLFDRVAEGEPIGWVGEDFRLDSMPRVRFSVVGLDPVEQRLLQDQLGAEGLELIGDWLRGRAQFERRRTISEVRVPRGAVLTVLEVSGRGWRGELGIVRDSPRNVQRSKIRVFTDEREAALLDLPGRPVPILGALAFDQLELNDRFDDVTADERERIRRLVQGRNDELILDLIARYPKLSRLDKTRAAELVRHLLLHWPPGTGGYAARSHKQRKLFAALAELPVFAGARKPWSATELAEARERGPIVTIGYRKQVALPEGPVVLLDADDVEPTLEALFGDTRDLYAELEREQQLAARKAAAPRLPSGPPSGALASLEISSERLAGFMWISPGHTEVLFGAEGRAVDRRKIGIHCWCAGAIWGEGLNIAADWSRVILSRSQDRMLERRAVELWDKLLDEFLRASEREGLRTTAERQRYVSTRDALLGLFMRLHAALGSKGGARKRSRKGNVHERLYDRLCDAPLLELSNGRWISADVAARERPIELASLELWSGPSAEELAHQRALERREAERRRQAQLEEQRRAQAEQRRRAAEALAREAARRREAKRRAEAEAREREAAKRQRAEREAAERARAAATVTPEAQLLEALREELRLVRAGNRGLLSNRLLDSVVLGSPVRRGPLFRHVDNRTEIDTGHRLFQAVLDGYLEDPVLLTLLASSAYTFLNVVHTEIADADEAEFLRLHAAHAKTRVLAG